MILLAGGGSFDIGLDLLPKRVESVAYLSSGGSEQSAREPILPGIGDQSRYLVVSRGSLVGSEEILAHGRRLVDIDAKEVEEGVVVGGDAEPRIVLVSLLGGETPAQHLGVSQVLEVLLVHATLLGLPHLPHILRAVQVTAAEFITACLGEIACARMEISIGLVEDRGGGLGDEGRSHRQGRCGCLTAC